MCHSLVQYALSSTEKCMAQFNGQTPAVTRLLCANCDTSISGRHRSKNFTFLSSEPTISQRSLPSVS